MTPLSRRLLILLAISGALNLLCAGLFIGSRIHRARLRESHAAHGERGFRGSGPRGEGPREAKGDGAGSGRGPRRGGPFAGLLAHQREDMLARRRAAKEAQKAAREALEREPFEPAALDQALGALRSETTKTQELLHRSLATAARNGSPEARKKLARGFDRALGPPH